MRLAAIAEDEDEDVDLHEDAADHDRVRAPVELTLFSGSSFVRMSDSPHRAGKMRCVPIESAL